MLRIGCLRFDASSFVSIDGTAGHGTLQTGKPRILNAEEDALMTENAVLK
ncbi:hypothetical protein ANDO1_1940 [plant metagenome]|uniref:Uncharacterized protein n=1 Tax=plant metagenome TaxID=1297885 RepID=A0A484P432_9ZZZZ